MEYDIYISSAPVKRQAKAFIIISSVTHFIHHCPQCRRCFACLVQKECTFRIFTSIIPQQLNFPDELIGTGRSNQPNGRTIKAKQRQTYISFHHTLYPHLPHIHKTERRQCRRHLVIRHHHNNNVCISYVQQLFSLRCIMLAFWG